MHKVFAQPTLTLNKIVPNIKIPTYTMNEDLYNYIDTLREDAMMAMDEYQTPEMAFTSTVLEKIEDLLDCKEITKEHCVITKSDGSVTGEIHAYSESTNGEVLYLFHTIYNHSSEIKTKSNTDCQTSFSRIQGFYNASAKAAYDSMDSQSSEYRASKFIYDNNHNYKSVNLIVLSNYLINNVSLKKIRIVSKPVFYDVWDLRKIYGNTHSMTDHVAIDIDFESEEYNRYKIPYIQMESSLYGYKCILAMFPAKLLYQLYERYNTNLLYNNVRYFLGLQGTKEKKPNVAMLHTLRKENEMFLAYNNGITALAKGVESLNERDKTDVSDPDNQSVHQYISMGELKKILDFRIINGGQTTAVLFNAKNLSDQTNDKDKKVHLLGVYVQVKLIISDEIEKISGSITQSSNFQNKVKYSDFSVSNEFNRKMEELSRSTRIPSDKNDISYWFYERLRGQYDEHKKRIHTKADKEYFDSQFPKSHKFSKEEVAKVWSNWNQSPYDSVKGSGTTYGAFMKGIVDRGYVPDETYYKQTIALLIIYKFLMARPENKVYANGKATIVAYAMAILAYRSFGKLDLISIWVNQSLSDNLKDYLNMLCDNIFGLFDTQARMLSTSILSYGKTKGAYDFIKSQPLDVDSHLLDADLM